MMDVKMYRQYLQQYVNDAIRNSDGSNSSISEYLDSIQIGRFFVRHREEKRRAVAEAKAAFDKNRHWPLEIVLSHLGIERQ
jgi:hypothetical protein